MPALSAAASASVGSLSDVAVAAAPAKAPNTDFATAPDAQDARGRDGLRGSEIECAAADRRAAGIAVGAGENQLAAAAEGHALAGTALANRSGDGQFAPGVAVTVRLLPRTTGTLIVWLPPLLAIGTTAVPLLSVNMLAVSPLLRLMA